jgi:hypothetical protein
VGSRGEAHDFLGQGLRLAGLKAAVMIVQSGLPFWILVFSFSVGHRLRFLGVLLYDMTGI